MSQSNIRRRAVLEADLWCGCVGVFTVASGVGVMTDTLGPIITGTIAVVGLETLRRIRNYLVVIDAERDAVMDTADRMQMGETPAGFNQTSRQSLLDHVYRVAKDNHDRGVDTDIEAVIREWIGPYDRQVRLFFQLTTLLFSIGLFGTVAGLTISFSAIATGIEGSTDIEPVMQSLRDAVSGMGTAMNTTLASTFFGGILLGILCYLAYSHTDNLVREVSAFMATVRFDVADGSQESEAA